MPNPHLPGPRFELSEGALSFIAARDERFRWGPKRRPNVSQIATIGGSVTPSTLAKIFRDELPVSLEALAGMVKATGARTQDEAVSALGSLLVWVPDAEDDEAVAA